MAGVLLLVMMIAPAVAAVGCILVGAPRVVEGLNLAAALVVCTAAILLTILSARGPYYYLSEYIVLDITGSWVILCTAIVYLLASIYSIGYMRLLGEDERLWGFYALFSGFALTILLSSVMNNAGLYWIAIELTTLVSTFLVGFERAAESIEAAWKYIIIISAGNQPRTPRYRPVLLVRQLCTRSDLRHDLGCLARGGTENEPCTCLTVIFAGARRIRDEGRSCTYAYLAARRP